MRNLPRSAFLPCLALLCGAGSSLAATGDDAATETDSGGGLQEIVITATRHEESLSKVPISVTALTQEMLDVRGIKDFQDVARFTPGIEIDNSGTNNIAIRGIASNGGAGTTGIYLDDSPIQMRALALNPDEALPKSFDLDRVEVLRGPQGTLFGAGSEGGTVRYITTQPSLTKTSVYSRDEVSFTQGGQPSYEAGVAAGTPLIDGKLGVRVSAWYRYDGGYIDHINPYTLQTIENKANYAQTKLLRIAAVWAPTDQFTVTPSFFYQDRYLNDQENYWNIYSNPGSNHFVTANPTVNPDPDTFWIGALKLEGDFGAARLISNTSYFHRAEQGGYEGTIYSLGYYQTFFTGTPLTGPALIDGKGLHLPAGISSYYSPATVNNGQNNFAQEVRLQSTDSSARLVWTTGIFFGLNHQSYLEQIHDPQLNQLTQAVAGVPFTAFFNYTDANGVVQPLNYDPRYPLSSYFLQTHSSDKQLAWFAEGTYAFTDQWKTTVGVRLSKTEFLFDTLTGGPTLFLPNQFNNGDKKENAFTPKLSIDYQYDPHNLYYFTYAKGFRPGGANSPVPQAACGTDFKAFGISQAPPTFNSDSVDSFEVGAKNNFDNRIKIASSLYYIRWNNIQEKVVPPICQISFIDNLGQAVAKGIDVQAEIAITDAFTTQISAGYTDARYTRDARLSSTGTAGPVVVSGDAIAGENGIGQSTGNAAPPYTVTLGFEYKFRVGSHDSFARIDDEYAARPKWATSGQDPNSLQYDPTSYTLSATNFASLRAGSNFGAWQVAAFIDNLTDTHTVTGYGFSINPNANGGTTPYSRLERDFTFRPRTFGLTFTYRSP